MSIILFTVVRVPDQHKGRIHFRLDHPFYRPKSSAVVPQPMPKCSNHQYPQSTARLVRERFHNWLLKSLSVYFALLVFFSKSQCFTIHKIHVIVLVTGYFTFACNSLAKSRATIPCGPPALSLRSDPKKVPFTPHPVPGHAGSHSAPDPQRYGDPACAAAGRGATRRCARRCLGARRLRRW